MPASRRRLPALVTLLTLLLPAPGQEPTPAPAAGGAPPSARPDAAPQPVVLTYDLPAAELAKVLAAIPGAEPADAVAEVTRLVEQNLRAAGLPATVRGDGATRLLVDLADRRLLAAVRDQIEPLDPLEWRFVASGDATADGQPLDLGRERDRLRRWLDAGGRELVARHPQNVAAFHRTADGIDAGKRIRWFPHEIRAGADGRWALPLSRIPTIAAVPLFTADDYDGGTVPARLVGATLMELVPVDVTGPAFVGADLRRDALTVARGGPPFGVHFGMTPARAAAYGDWTGRNLQRHLAIVLDGRLVTAPLVLSRIPGQGRIACPDEAHAEALAERLARPGSRFQPFLLRIDPASPDEASPDEANPHRVTPAGRGRR